MYFTSSPLIHNYHNNSFSSNYKHFGSRQILCRLVKYITWLQYSDGIQNLLQLLKYIKVWQKSIGYIFDYTEGINIIFTGRARTEAFSFS